MTPIKVGVRELKNKLSHYLEAAKEGQEVIVTDHGKPIARLIPIGETGDRLAELIARGEARAPLSPVRSIPKPIKARGTVSDLIAEQRR